MIPIILNALTILYSIRNSPTKLQVNGRLILPNTNKEKNATKNRHVIN